MGRAAMSASGAFRWLDGSTGRLYRQDEWVDALLTRIDMSLLSFRWEHVRFDGTRAALLAIGLSGRSLQIVRATYRDVVLFHPGLHPIVGRALDRAIDAAAREAQFPYATELRRHGRAVLLENPSIVLDKAVVEGLTDLGATRPLPLGVSGTVLVDAEDQNFVMAAVRSEQVALNPSCLGPPIDGGVMVGERPRSSRPRSRGAPDDVLRVDPRHFERTALALVPLGGPAEDAAEPVLAGRHVPAA
jgi:hypothetical protein